MAVFVNPQLKRNYLWILNVCKYHRYGSRRPSVLSKNDFKFKHEPEVIGDREEVVYSRQQEEPVREVRTSKLEIQEVSRELPRMDNDDFPKFKSPYLFSSRKGFVGTNLKRTDAHSSQTKINLPLVKGEVLYGVHPVSIALEVKRREIHAVYYKDGLEVTNKNIQNIIKLCDAERIPSRSLHLYSLNRLTSSSAVHQGVCADVGRLKTVPFSDVEETACEESQPTSKESTDSLSVSLVKQSSVWKEARRRVWLVLAGVQDPMNFGAIIRSAYYFGVDKVFTLTKNSCPLSPHASKASSGALELLPIYHISDLQEFLQGKLLNGWNVLGTVTSMDGTLRGSEEETVVNEDIPSNTKEEISPPIIDAMQYKESNSVVLILGGESTGLPQDIKLLCSGLLTIPPHQELHQGIDSLNVSTAAAVILHSLNSNG